MIRALRLLIAGLVAGSLSAVIAARGDADGDRARLVAALLGVTPLEADLEALSDRIGGRATGSEANRQAVAWAESRLREAGVATRREPFTVPVGWLERSARADVKGEGVQFAPRSRRCPTRLARRPEARRVRSSTAAGALKPTSRVSGRRRRARSC